METSSRCTVCDAPTSGLVCQFCGHKLTRAEDLHSEQDALDQLHRLLHEADDERQARLLTCGFLPTHKRVLINAGLRVMPLVNTDDTAGDTSQAARQRLEAIVAALRLCDPDVEIRRAVAEFEKKLGAYARADRVVTAVALVLIVGGVAGVVLLIARC